MGKPLSEMSKEELWQLFPIILKEYNPAYLEWFLEQKKRILEVLEHAWIFRIQHVGSTAVPGLLTKPTVDILLELLPDINVKVVRERLLGDGWLEMVSEEHPALRLVFNKGYTPEGFAEKVYHLHVRRAADWDELYFRDYLQRHSEAAAEYAQLKRGLLLRYEHDRDGYTEAKTEFIRKYTALAREEFDGRYFFTMGSQTSHL